MLVYWRVLGFSKWKPCSAMLQWFSLTPKVSWRSHAGHIRTAFCSATLHFNYLIGIHTSFITVHYLIHLGFIYSLYIIIHHTGHTDTCCCSWYFETHLLTSLWCLNGHPLLSARSAPVSVRPWPRWHRSWHARSEAKRARATHRSCDRQSPPQGQRQSHVEKDNVVFSCIVYRLVTSMIWYAMIWYDMIWYGMIWYDMIWSSSVFTKCLRKFLRVSMHDISKWRLRRSHGLASGNRLFEVGVSDSPVEWALHRRWLLCSQIARVYPISVSSQIGKE